MRTTTPNSHSQPPTSNYSPSVPVFVYRELVAELQAAQAKLDVVIKHNHKLSQENQHLRQEINRMVESCLELQKRLEYPENASPSQPHHQDGRNAPPRKHSPQPTTSPNTPPPPGYYYDVGNVPPQPQSPQPGTDINVNSAPQPQPPSPESKVKNKPKSKPQQRTNTENKSKGKKKVKTAPPPRKPKNTKPQPTIREVVSVPMMDMNFPVSEPVYIEEQEVHYYLPLESEPQGLSGWWLVFTIFLIMITGFSAGYLIVRPLLQSQTQGN